MALVVETFAAVVVVAVEQRGIDFPSKTDSKSLSLADQLRYQHHLNCRVEGTAVQTLAAALRPPVGTFAVLADATWQQVSCLQQQPPPRHCVVAVRFHPNQDCQQ